MYFSYNKIRMKSLAANGDKKAKKVLRLSENSDRLISTILIGNNICNVAATTIAGIMFLDIISSNAGLAGTVSTIVMTVVMLLFGEITPKTIFKKNPDYFAMLFADVMRFFYYLLFPLAWLFGLWQKLLEKIGRKNGADRITDDELITYVDEAETGGSINEAESELIRSAIEFDEQMVKEILTPRVKVEALPEGCDCVAALRLFRESGYSRIPVFSGSIDRIVGILNVKDFYSVYLDGDATIDRAVSHDVIFVAPSMRINDLMRRLQHDKNHIAVVVDESGGTDGIVTLEDILEELVGEIWDENDDVIEYFKEIGENVYDVDCSVSFSDFTDFFALKIDEDDYDCTLLSGFISDLLRRIPRAGDEAIFMNLKIKVTECADKTAAKCTVEVLPKDEEADA